MTIEQSSELNALFHQEGSSGSHTLKQKAWSLLPALLLLLAPWAGIVFLHGIPITDALGGFVGLLIVLAVIVLIDYLATRRLQTVRRKFETNDNGVRLSHSQQKRIPWKLVKAWHFEPVENRSDLMKVTLKWALGARIRSWSILSTMDEQKSFLAELHERQGFGSSHFSIQTFRAPIPYPHFKAKPAVTCLYIVSIFFLFSGGLVLLSLTPHGQRKSAQHPVRLNPAVQHYLQDFHNKSEEERQRIALFYGALLLVPGAFGMVMSLRLLNRNTRERRDANSAAEASVRLQQWPPGE